MTSPGGTAQPGSELGGYSTLSVVGQGATGTVRVMRHDATGQLVAVKSLTQSLVGDPVFRARFRQEATILERVRHPNIAGVHWYVETTVDAAIGMELVNGVQLGRLIAQGAATPEAALSVLRGSLAALEHAHRAGVVHRDYKPANVLVDAGGTSRLVDFGIASGVGEAGIAEGTAAYAAPEQWHGATAMPATDVYACAAVLHQCITGRVPYTAPDFGGLRRLHEAAPIPLDHVPAPLHPLLQRGLAKSAEARYATAGEFLDDLERIATATYGHQWAERGARALAGLALGFAVFFPLHGVAAASAAAGAPALSVAAPPPPAPAGSVVTHPGGLVRPASRVRSLLGTPGTIAAAVVTVAAAATGGLALAHRGPFSTAPAGAVPAATTIDIRGSWDAIALVGSAQSRQRITYTTENFSSGAVTGTDVGGGSTFTVSGTLEGSTLTTDTRQVGGSSVSHQIGTVTSSGGTLRMSGTFTDSNGRSGTFTATMIAARPSGPSLPVGGVDATLTISHPGEMARFTFAGTAGQRVFVDVPSASISDECGVLTLSGPDGIKLATGCVAGGVGEIDSTLLPDTGQYTVTVGPSRSAGAVKVRVITDVDQQSTIEVDGPAVTATIAQPGALARLTFHGIAGQRVFVDIPTATIPNECANQLVSPDGSALGGGCILNGSGFIDAVVLPATGQYTIQIARPGRGTGTAQVQVIGSTDQQSAILLDGPEVTATIARPGAVTRLTFSGMAGQRVVVDVPSSTLPADCSVLSLLGPDGAKFAGGCIVAGKGSIDATVLPASGEYTVVVDPTGRETGDAQVRVHT